MGKVDDVINDIKNSLMGAAADAQAQMEQHTKQVIDAIKQDQKPLTDKVARLKKAVKKAAKAKYPTLLDEIYQYANKDLIEVNSNNQIRYTFTLQPAYAFLESMLANRLNDVSLTLEDQGVTYSVSFRVEMHER